MSTAGEFTILIILAMLVEMLVEYLFKPLIPTPDVGAGLAPAPWYHRLPFARYAAALVGVGLAIYYQLDLLSMMFPAYLPNLVGMILTGLLLSRGANYLHDWIANPIVKALSEDK
jgi:hypothetical protein